VRLRLGEEERAGALFEKGVVTFSRGKEGGARKKRLRTFWENGRSFLARKWQRRLRWPLKEAVPYSFRKRDGDGVSDRERGGKKKTTRAGSEGVRMQLPHILLVSRAGPSPCACPDNLSLLEGVVQGEETSGERFHREGVACFPYLCSWCAGEVNPYRRAKGKGNRMKKEKSLNQ